MRIRNDVKLSWKIEKCLKWRKEFLCQHRHYSLNICHWSYVPCQRRNIDSCSNFVFRNVISFTLLVKTSHEMGISRKITRPAACTYESLKIPLEFKTRWSFLLTSYAIKMSNSKKVKHFLSRQERISGGGVCLFIFLFQVSDRSFDQILSRYPLIRKVKKPRPCIALW